MTACHRLQEQKRRLCEHVKELYTALHSSAQHVHQESRAAKVLGPRLRFQLLMVSETDATP